LDVIAVGARDWGAASGQLGTEYVDIDYGRGTFDAHASAMALRKASSCSSVSPSITVSS